MNEKHNNDFRKGPNKNGYDGDPTWDLRVMNDWVNDIHEMHAKFGVHEWMEKNKDNSDLMQRFMDFRLAFLQEELDETKKAVFDSDASEVVDGLIDLCVIAIGTLDAFNVPAHEAWNRVHKANMAKEVGIKESRPNPLGLPDLVKPENWESPKHNDITGYIDHAL